MNDFLTNGKGGKKLKPWYINEVMNLTKDYNKTKLNLMPKDKLVEIYEECKDPKIRRERLENEKKLLEADINKLDEKIAQLKIEEKSNKTINFSEIINLEKQEDESSSSSSNE